jgi:hypothetical protein
MGIANMTDSEFAEHVNNLIEDTASDVCEFEDVPDFEADFYALCVKYREKAKARPVMCPQCGHPASDGHVPGDECPE